MRKRTTNDIGGHPIYSDYCEVVHSWMLQLLVPLGGHKGIIHEHRCDEDDVLQELGLSHLLEAKEFNAGEARQALQKMHGEITPSSIADIPSHTQLAKNIRWLGKIIGLSKTEQSILHFRVIASRHLTLRNCLLSLGQGIDMLYAANIFGELLDVDEAEVEQAFKPGARLIRSGLISIPPKLDDLIDKISILPGLADNLFVGHETPIPYLEIISHLPMQQN